MSKRASVPGSIVLPLLLCGGIGAVIMQRARCPIAIRDDAVPAVLDRASWPDMRVDLNAAAPRDMTVLPGIGPKLAERIVADRIRRGRFISVRDMERVERVGPATVRAIEPYVFVGDFTGDARAFSPAATISSR